MSDSTSNTEERVEQVGFGTDMVWTLCSAGAIFLMQAGFQFLEAGQVRRKHQRNAVLKSYIGICFGALFFYLIGYGVAFGEVKQNTEFAGKVFFADKVNSFKNWCFQFAFLAAFIAIVNGSLLERAKTELYLIFVPVLASVIYPVVVAWTWGQGWLSEMEYVDFAGSSVVHLAGAVCTFTTSIVLGPRNGRFRDDHQQRPVNAREPIIPEQQPANASEPRTTESIRTQADPEMIARNYEDNMQAYNIPMVGLGVMTLWFGWLYFNAGSTLATSRPDSAAMAERAFMNTIIGPATAGITCFFTRKHIAGFHEMKGTKWDVVAMLNGVLCGLVAITGSCAVVDVWAAVIIGGVAPIFYALTLRIIDHWKIDDPSEAFPIHGPCGAWGIIAAAFFDKDQGVFYGHSGKTIGVQLLGIIVIIAWDVACCLCILLPLKYLAHYNIVQWLRVSMQEEEYGIDYYNHQYRQPWYQDVPNQQNDNLGNNPVQEGQDQIHIN